MAHDPNLDDGPAKTGASEERRTSGKDRRAARKDRRSSNASAGEGSGESGSEGARTKQIVAGAAIGIGSAAIVAALLYANRRGRTDKT